MENPHVVIGLNTTPPRQYKLTILMQSHFTSASNYFVLTCYKRRFSSLPFLWTKNFYKYCVLILLFEIYKSVQHRRTQRYCKICGEVSLH